MNYTQSARTYRQKAKLLRDNAQPLLVALARLTEKTKRANAIQHSGQKVTAEDWSELHQLTNEAEAAIQKATQL
jgi:hypothetical protein